MSKVFGRQDFYTAFRQNNIRVTISYNYYNCLIKKLHDKIISELLNGNEIILPYSLGSLIIKRRVRKNPVPDWGKSDKLKAKLIEQGKTIYKILEKDKNGNVVKHNNGEKWIIYHTDYYYYELAWIKGKDTKYIPNIKYYKSRTIDTLKNKISEKMHTLSDMQKETLFI